MGERVVNEGLGAGSWGLIRDQRAEISRSRNENRESLKR